MVLLLYDSLPVFQCDVYGIATQLIIQVAKDIFNLISVIIHSFQNYHEAQELTDDDIKSIAALSDMKHFRSVLDEILIPRVVGTPDHEKVGNFIVGEMRGLGWNVEEDIFTADTPVFGPLNFRNIIATLNPDADRYLLLACHYDSKYTREHIFLGKFFMYLEDPGRRYFNLTISNF